MDWPRDEDDSLPFTSYSIHILGLSTGLALGLALGLPIQAQLAHRQVFQNPFLDVLQSVMVFIQHNSGVLYVQVVFAADLPGQAGEPIQVGAYDPILRRSTGEFG
jgi:hypothetical protein